MLYSARAHPLDELLQESIAAMKHCKVSGTVDWHKLFARRIEGFEVMVSERSWSCEVLLALKNKYRNGEFQAKVCRPDGLDRWHEAIETQQARIHRIIRGCSP